MKKKTYPKIVKYVGDAFDLNQAIRDGGWPDPEYPSLYRGLKLKDRLNGHKATVRNVVRDDFGMPMYMVNFVGGGWLCLDHAINQYEVANQ